MSAGCFVVVLAFAAGSAFAESGDVPVDSSDALPPSLASEPLSVATEEALPEVFRDGPDRDPSTELGWEPAVPGFERVGFTIGPMAGYLKQRGADRGTWFGGAVARLYLLRILAAEASISFHESRFNDGDVRVTQYPVQVSGLLIPFEGLPIDPYVVGGVGWYYTRVTTRGAFSVFKNETDHVFGAHLGAGAELRASAPITLFADFRYVFLHPDSDVIENRDFSFWQVTLGVLFGF